MGKGIEELVGCRSRAPAHLFMPDHLADSKKKEIRRKKKKTHANRNKFPGELPTARWRWRPCLLFSFFFIVFLFYFSLSCNAWIRMRLSEMSRERRLNGGVWHPKPKTFISPSLTPLPSSFPPRPRLFFASLSMQLFSWWCNSKLTSHLM